MHYKYKSSLLIDYSSKMCRYKCFVHDREFKKNRFEGISIKIFILDNLESKSNVYKKETHDPNEDAKIALSLAKLRIEILEHFPMPNLVQPITATPDVFLQLKKYGGIQLIEKKSLVEYFIKFEAGFEDVD